MSKRNDTTNSLAHTKWNCKYHIVFAPKYRRKVFYEEKRLEIRDILRQICAWKGVEIIEGEICPDHVHLLVPWLLCRHGWERHKSNQDVYRKSIKDR